MWLSEGFGEGLGLAVETAVDGGGVVRNGEEGFKLLLGLGDAGGVGAAADARDGLNGGLFLRRILVSVKT